MSFDASGFQNTNEAGSGSGNGAPGGDAGGPSNGRAASEAPSLLHIPGLSLHWSAEEQAILEQGLSEYASESSVMRYAKIAAKLPDKSIRDVAMRYQWMIKAKKGKEPSI